MKHGNNEPRVLGFLLWRLENGILLRTIAISYQLTISFFFIYVLFFKCVGQWFCTNDYITCLIELPLEE